MSAAVEPVPTPVIAPTASTVPVRRWDRGLARVLLLLWLVGTISAWVLGTRVVSLDQLTRDAELGNVAQLAVVPAVEGSTWWGASSDPTSGVEEDDGGPGIVLYRRSDSDFARTFAVAPAGSDSPRLPGVDGFTGVMNGWGEQKSEVQRSIAAVERSHWPGVQLDSRWTSVLVPASMLAGFLGALAMLLTRRPERGTRWYWFWLLLLVPAGLGWAAYAWREYLARDAGQPRPSRESGWSGFFYAILLAIALVAASIALPGALGITVLPA